MYGHQSPIRAFRDRRQAGEALAAGLAEMVSSDALVLALPRGGIPVAAKVASVLGLQLDVLIVRKVGAPGQPEFGIGAVAEGGVRIVDSEMVGRLGISRSALESSIAAAEAEVESRIARFRGEAEPLDLRDRDVVIVDDGLATGGTAAAAVVAVRQLGARRVQVAVPVGSGEACAALERLADGVLCLIVPEPLHAVGHWYSDFGQLADAEVVSILGRHSSAKAGPVTSILPAHVSVEAGAGRTMNGDLAIPARPRGLVIFAHGSGSSRLSPRNRHVAEALQHAGLATLLLDLLAEDEEGDRRKVFDIPLLASRLAAATDWAASQPETASLPRGYFGASTGAAAALFAAAGREDVAAVVSRGGRPDLAGPLLADVKVPVLLLVGGDDREVIGLNRSAQRQLGGIVDLAVIPGAGHLFEEAGTLDVVAAQAAGWFLRFLPAASLRA